MGAAPKSSSSSSSCKKKKKALHLHAVTLVVMCGIVVTVVCRGHHKTKQLLLVDEARIPEPPYPDEDADADAAERDRIQWDSIAATIAGTSSRSGSGSVALLNFRPAEVKRWRKLQLHAKVQAVQLQPTLVTWDALYPEWIDEEDSSRRRCPSLPEPHLPRFHFDLVAVNLPCRNTSSCSRDVASLHLQLSAAKLALLSHFSVLILSHCQFKFKCIPLPNLFPCKHLVRRHAHYASLYSPDADYLRHRLSLPVGSCDLALPLPLTATANLHPNQKEAYATVLQSSAAYLCGAIALAHSIRHTGSTRDMVALVDDSISITAGQRAGLTAAGWQVRAMQRIRNPRAVPGSYNEWNYSKFRLWQLTDYHRVVFVDADQLVLRNIDFLFAAAVPELSATGNSGTLFNSGVMVVEPSNCTFDLLMSGVHEVRSYNGGDQGYLNEVFTWWHRLPRHLNVLKYYNNRHHHEHLHAHGALNSLEPYMLHYLGIKPWLCFRDYDCNWNVPWLRRFASDEAHARWWAVHDGITPATRFCTLPAKRRAALEYERRQAEMANATDMQWSRVITDPRMSQQLQVSLCFVIFYKTRCETFTVSP